jgi:hypothetical protein
MAKDCKSCRLWHIKFSLKFTIYINTTSIIYNNMDHSLIKVNKMIADKNRLHRFNEHCELPLVSAGFR